MIGWPYSPQTTTNMIVSYSLIFLFEKKTAAKEVEAIHAQLCDTSNLLRLSLLLTNPGVTILSKAWLTLTAINCQVAVCNLWAFPFVICHREKDTSSQIKQNSAGIFSGVYAFKCPALAPNCPPVVWESLLEQHLRRSLWQAPFPYKRHMGNLYAQELRKYMYLACHLETFHFSSVERSEANGQISGIMKLMKNIAVCYIGRLDRPTSLLQATPLAMPKVKSDSKIPS